MEATNVVGSNTAPTPPVIVESSAKIVSPRVTRASLPPVTLPSGQLECPACGGAFDNWENYYGHVIAPDNKVCAWVQIDLIDARRAASRAAVPRRNPPFADRAVERERALGVVGAMTGPF